MALFRWEYEVDALDADSWKFKEATVIALVSSKRNLAEKTTNILRRRVHQYLYMVARPELIVITMWPASSSEPSPRGTVVE